MRYLLFVFVILLLSLSVSPQQPTPVPQDDLVRIKTELRQATVTVLDRKGRRVDNLSREDFELLVDGRPIPIEFFENIATGSTRDRSIRGESTATAGLTRTAPGRQPRIIVIFIDDYHLSLTGVNRTRAAIREFIENRMTPHDRVAIASATGRLGFLQQFTQSKDVLRAAVERIRPSFAVALDYSGTSGTPLTEYNARSIERRDDPGLLEVYVENCMKSAPPASGARMRRSLRETCAVEVRNRARQVVLQAGNITDGTYTAFESLLRTAARMPGSKLAFFVSDGFLADLGVTGRVSADRLARITKAAREAAVVVYSIDSKGLVSGALDATAAIPADPNGRLAQAESRAIAASQDALNAIAVDTGGRALRNQNDFSRFLNEALDETSRYYLIAWAPPEQKTQESPNIEIRITGRPELTVHSTRKPAGDRSGAVARADFAEKVKTGGRETDLKEALSEIAGGGSIPVYLSLSYVDTPNNGPVLTVSTEVADGTLSYGVGGKEIAQLTLAGIILDSNGKTAGSFGTRLSVNPREGSEYSKVIYNYPVPLKPGLYQVRVAARDDRAGSMGRADQWIAIPDLSSGELWLSSVFLGIRKVESKNQSTDHMQWSVDRRFAAGSRLDFFFFIYSLSKQNALLPDLTVRASIVQDGREVASSFFDKIAIDKQSGARIPFSAGLSLRNLPPGAYILNLTVEDRATKRVASKEEPFMIE